MENNGKAAGESGKKPVPDFIAKRGHTTPKKSGKFMVAGLIVFVIGAALIIFGHLTNPDDRVVSFFVKNGRMYSSSSSAVELSQDSPLFRMLSSDAPELVENLETTKTRKKQARYFWLAGYSLAIIGIVLFGIGYKKKLQ